jgi:hypothetical protein
VIVKDYIYLGVIVLLVGLGIYIREHLINEGERIAQAREVKAAEKQKVLDKQLADGVVHDLNAEIAVLQHASSTRPPVSVRCTARPVSTPPATTGNLGPPAPSGSVHDVPSGAGEGPDLAGSLSWLAFIADTVSARDRACVAWAKGMQ